MSRLHQNLVGGIAILLSALQVSGPAGAATSDGSFAVRGIGAQTCSAVSGALQGDAAPATRANLAAWLAGWLSHANRTSEGNFDVSPIQDIGGLVQVVMALCRQNPDAIMETVVSSVTDALRDPAGAPASDIVTIEVDGQGTQMRAAALKRAQERLVALGLLEEKMADGAFGPASRQAFAAFQAKQGIKETGVPDPVTLFLLLRAAE